MTKKKTMRDEHSGVSRLNQCTTGQHSEIVKTFLFDELALGLCKSTKDL